MHNFFLLFRAMARRVLPRAARARLYGLYFLLEAKLLHPLFGVWRRRFCPKLADVQARTVHGTGPILLVNDALSWGGVERQIVYTLIGLKDRFPQGIGLLCLRLGTTPDHDFYLSELSGRITPLRNISVYDEALRVLAHHLPPDRKASIDSCLSWLPKDAQIEIYRFLAEFLTIRPSVVHAWQDSTSIHAGFAALLAGVPKIIIAGRNVAPINFNYYRAYMREAYRDLADCKRLVMINNSRVGADSYAAFLKVNAQRFQVVRNGIPATASLPPAPAEVTTLRLKLGIPPEARVVGAIFRLYAEKDPLTWIRAAAAIAEKKPNIYFVIFGTGPLRDEAMAEAAALGLADRVRLPGTIDRPALALALFDVFMLTSIFEGTPNVVIEASMAKVPVVACNAGGTAEAIDDGKTGFLVPVGDHAALATRVLTVLEDEPLRRRLGEEGPAFIARRFGLQRMLDETERLYTR